MFLCSVEQFQRSYRNCSWHSVTAWNLALSSASLTLLSLHILLFWQDAVYGLDRLDVSNMYLISVWAKGRTRLPAFVLKMKRIQYCGGPHTHINCESLVRNYIKFIEFQGVIMIVKRFYISYIIAQIFLLYKIYTEC